MKNTFQSKKTTRYNYYLANEIILKKEIERSKSNGIVKINVSIMVNFWPNFSASIGNL